jgi:CO/xanthine dehydrogenase FAD-binding subunit
MALDVAAVSLVEAGTLMVLRRSQVVWGPRKGARMANVLNYHRPESLDAALALLQRTQPTVILGGGSHLVPSLTEAPTDVVDLQALGLRGICEDGHLVALGAMATFADLAACAQLPAGVRELARREAPSTLRTLATVGGLVASGDADSELLASFLVMGATVTVISADGRRTIPLDTFLAAGIASGEIIVCVNVDPSVTVLSARTVRTGMDRAIVAVVGARFPDGTIVLAATGAANTPVVFSDPTSLTPRSDFRGTKPYRLQLAAVLSARVRSELTA